jgi:hypothetical protein
MILYTVDEARAAVVASARSLIERCQLDDPFLVAVLLWGAGDVDDTVLAAADLRLVRRHRQLLDRLIAAGYVGDVVDELDGISSACLADGELDRHVLSAGA